MMKRKRFTEEQIIGILREQEAGTKTADFGFLTIAPADRTPRGSGSNSTFFAAGA
jgi:hypothetical protein